MLPGPKVCTHCPLCRRHPIARQLVVSIGAPLGTLRNDLKCLPHAVRDSKSSCFEDGKHQLGCPNCRKEVSEAPKQMCFAILVFRISPWRSLFGLLGDPPLLLIIPPSTGCFHSGLILQDIARYPVKRGSRLRDSIEMGVELASFRSGARGLLTTKQFRQSLYPGTPDLFCRIKARSSFAALCQIADCACNSSIVQHHSSLHPVLRICKSIANVSPG